ncbi:hypothetical protein [Hathewaya massiliensis]|uniref:hypothetical protein n=1 Tax=Hathewaya massiliensis TaxID=1964382 RepID=UPI001157D629|nr:hypothetical protein [Hathewaya massiliensis]
MNKKNEDFTCTKCGGNDFCYVDGIKFCNLCGEYLEVEKDALRSIEIDGIFDNEIQIEKINIQNKDLKRIILNKDKKIDYKDEEDEFDLIAYKNYTIIEGKESCDVMDREDLAYIEDEDGLNELLEDRDLYKSNFEEEFPGLIVVKKSKFK